MTWLLLAAGLAVLVLALPICVVVLLRWVYVLQRRVATLETRMAREEATSGMPAPAPAPTPIPAAASTPPLTPSSTAASPPTHAALQTPELQPVAPGAAEAENWEVVVGTTWLNKIGVLVLVLGVGFLMAYSFARVGPEGRVALGYAASAALLAAGVRLGRRPAFRAYGQSLAAGGWAGAYFTTFAARAVPAARVIDSDAAAVLALLVVAAGMIAHAVRERSPAMTVLAYIAAYAALASTPLNGFSLVASLPLTMSLVAVAVRMQWPAVALFGIAATYALLALRSQLIPGMGQGGSAAVHLAVLAFDWLLFEAADVAARKRRVPLMAANAAGVVGAGLLLIPNGDPVLLSRFLGVVALGYLGSALVRTRTGRGDAAVDANAPSGRFSSVHFAVILSAALFGWVVVLRLDGPRQTMALLLETELLLAAAMSLRDGVLRKIAGIAAAVTTLDAWFLIFGDTGTLFSGALPAQVPVVALVALVWYVDEAWIRRATGTLSSVERGYTWAAFVLSVAAIVQHGPSDYVGTILLGVGVFLLERSRRVPQDLRAQAALSAILGALGVLASFALDDPQHGRSIWIALPIATALGYAFAWRLRDDRAEPVSSSTSLLEGAMLLAATAILATFEWHVMPRVAIAPIWGLTGLVLGVLRPGRVSPGLAPGTGLLGLAVLRTLSVVLERGAAPARDVVAAAVVIAILFAVDRLSSRRSLTTPDSAAAGVKTQRDLRLERGLATAVATVLLMIVSGDRLRAGLITPAWGLEGLVLLGTGFFVRDRTLRLSGLGVLLTSLLKLFLYDLSALEPLARILSFVVLGLVLLGVSWAYTRYREAMNRLL